MTERTAPGEDARRCSPRSGLAARWAFAVAAFSLAACATGEVTGGDHVPAPSSQAAAPRLLPGTSSSPSPIDVAITCESQGTLPYRTTDGSAPSTASTQSDTATFSSSGVLRAICAGGELQPSLETSASYTISSLPAAAAPTFAPGTSTWQTSVTTTITCSTSGTRPYQTIDGSTPTTASTQSGTATFTSSGTLKAICAGAGFADSAVSTATYTIAGAPPSGYSTHGFTIPSDHPRLWFNAARLAQAQTWLAAHPFTATSNFEVAWRHAVTGTSDCASAIDWATAWKPPPAQINPDAAGSDQMRLYGEDAILVFDWCYDQWTSGEKRAFITNMNTWIGTVRQQAWGGFYGGAWQAQSNYFWGNFRNEVEWGIASYGDNGAGAGSTADDFIDYALERRWTEGFVPTATSSAAGGSTDEGPVYGATMLTYPLIPLVTMGLGGRDLYNETGFFKQGVYWTIYNTMPGSTFNVGTGDSSYELNSFADDELAVGGGVLVLRSYYQSFMTFAASAWPEVNAGKHARQWLNTVGAALSKGPERFVAVIDSGSAAASYRSLPLDYYTTGIKYFFGRKAWDASSSAFVWQMDEPDAGGHNHRDAGNFNVWRGGRWLTRETTGYSDGITGYGYQGIAADDTYSMLAHNGLVFGSLLYPSAGKLLPAIAQRHPVVTRLESRADYAYAAVDLTGRYLWDGDHSVYDTGAVVHVERELLFLRALETTLVFDRLTTGSVIRGPDSGTSAADEVTTFVIHFETSPSLEDATHMTATNGPQALRATTLVPATPTARRVIDEGGSVGLYRVEIDTKGAAQRYFLHVLQGRDASGGTAANLSASVVDSNPADPVTGTFTVTLQPPSGTATTIVLDKGAVSSGGTVNLAGVGARALRTTVQTISYSDDGPIWAQ